jgi:light-independent protochlorophyllide reductase subunit N
VVVRANGLDYALTQGEDTVLAAMVNRCPQQAETPTENERTENSHGKPFPRFLGFSGHTESVLENPIMQPGNSPVVPRRVGESSGHICGLTISDLV